MTDRNRVMELWDATHPYHLDTSPSKLRQFFELKKAAVELAKVTGRPLNYFTQAQIFQDQHYTLRKRFIERIGLASLVRLRQRLASSHN